jgi:hypothetical protein
VVKISQKVDVMMLKNYTKIAACRSDVTRTGRRFLSVYGSSAQGLQFFSIGFGTQLIQGVAGQFFLRQVFGASKIFFLPRRSRTMPHVHAFYLAAAEQCPACTLFTSPQPNNAPRARFLPRRSRTMPHVHAFYLAAAEQCPTCTLFTSPHVPESEF